MSKNVVLAIFALLFIGVCAIAYNIKSAYKIIPMSTSSQMEIPAYADWREFTPQTKKFKVSLPAVPQAAHETVDIPNSDKKRFYEMYVSQKLNGAIFMVSLITYPPDYSISDPHALLKEVIDEMAKTNPNNHLDKLTDKQFLNQPAYEFNLTNSDFGVEGMAFLAGKTAYLLTYISKNSAFNEDEYKHFISTFQLISK